MDELPNLLSLSSLSISSSLSLCSFPPSPIAHGIFLSLSEPLKKLWRGTPTCGTFLVVQWAGVKWEIGWMDGWGGGKALMADVHSAPLFFLPLCDPESWSPDGKNAAPECKSGPCLLQPFRSLIPVQHLLSSTRKYEPVERFYSSWVYFRESVCVCATFSLHSNLKAPHFLFCLSQFFPLWFSQSSWALLGFFFFSPAGKKGCNELAESCVVACREAFRPLFDRGSCTITGLMALCVCQVRLLFFFFSSSSPLQSSLTLSCP